MPSKSKKRYADGGKVRSVRRISRLLESDPQFALHRWQVKEGIGTGNVPFYDEILNNEQWDPDVTPKDLRLLADYSGGLYWDWGKEQIQRLDELIKKYGIRPRNYNTWRGLEMDPDHVADLKPGDALKYDFPSSTSVSKDMAEVFAHQANLDEARVPTLLRIAPNPRLALPVPFSGQSELLMPSGEAGKLLVDKVKKGKKHLRLDVEAEPHPGFAGGGRVLPSSTEDEESWTDTYLKRPLSGLASMWGAADPETGEFINPVVHNLRRAWNMDERRRQGLPDQERANLGIIDETLSIPALGEIVGLPAPQFASKASDRADQTRKAARGALGLDAPHGFTENLTESAGVMAGQLPVPASIVNRLKLLKNGSKLAKVASPAVEWFSPTVVPRANNYLKGALFGGTLGGGLDHLEDHLDDKEQEERHKQFISEAVAEVLAEENQGSDEDIDDALAELGYAEGGRVKTAKRVVGSLREMLAETASDDVVTRKSKIDEALHAIKGTVGPSEIGRQHLHTLVGGLSDAAADPSPVRRRQRFGDYESNLLQLLEKQAPLLADRPVPTNLPPIVSNLPPPVRPVAADDTARGRLSDAEYNQEIQALVPAFNFAEGGRVGAPQSQEWYETYGAGPEHLFLGERSIPSLEGWSPSRPTTQTPPLTGHGGSSTVNDLVGLASLGLIGYDAYRDLTQQDLGSGLSGLDWNSLDLDFDDVDTQGTLDWINRDLSDMEMPTAEFDPTAMERVGQGASGAFDLAMGAAQGGVGGTGSMLQGGSDIYQALSGNDSALMERVGVVGSMLSNLGDGTVKGYIAAGGDAAELAQAMGYSGPLVDAAGEFLPVVGNLFNAYEGIQEGGVRGYVSAAGNLMQAYSALQGAGLLGGAGAAGAAGAGAAGAGAAAAGAAGAGAGAAGAAGAAGTAGAAGAAGTAGAAGAGTAGATTGAAGAGAGAGGAMASLGPALALWAAAASAMQWAGNKYGDTKIGDVYGTDWMSGPVDETRYYWRNKSEGDVGSFDIHSDDVGAAPTAALREQWQQQGIDDSGIGDYDARVLSHLQNQGQDTGYNQYMDWLTGADPNKEELENFDWDSYFNDNLVVPVI